MNYHVMMKQYKDSDIISKVEGSSKHEFIEIVLEELSYNLKVLVDAILVEKKTSKIKSKKTSKIIFASKQKTSKIKSKSFSKIITSLMILMSSLDFKKGKEIAVNLNNLYDYCRRQTLDSYKNQTIDGLNSSIGVIDDILSAWKQIK